MKFDCFLFDFDGTLAYSEHAYRVAFLHSIERHTGVLPNEVEFRDFWNVTPHEVLGVTAKNCSRKCSQALRGTTTPHITST